MGVTSSVSSVGLMEFFILLLLLGLVDGYARGAPGSTCLTRYPKHSNTPTRTDESPFTVTFEPQVYDPNDEIQVTIEDPNGLEFKGIQIGAFRDSGNTEEIVGQFIDFPADKLQTITCFPGYKNMITHRNPELVMKLVLKWKAPSVNVGNLTFRTTIVEKYDKFWTGIEAPLPSNNSDPSLISAPSMKLVPTEKLVRETDFSECGDTKGCFLYPRHCTGDDCVAAVSFQYREDTDDYMFEMYTDASATYLSVAFSDDRVMGNDETVTCVSRSGEMSFQHGWNPMYYNERQTTRFVSKAEISHTDGRLQCRFVLPKQTWIYLINFTAPALEYANSTFDHEEAKYMQLAWGHVMPDSDVITFHGDMPATSFDKVDLKDKAIHHGTAFHILVQVHGGLMMVAWIFFAGIVTVISRHYRDWMPRTRWFGAKVWFQVHRALAILIVVLTAIGLTVIFAHYGAAIREEADPHAYVGLAVTAAVGLQVIAGMLRPGPDHKMRVYFNWGHRFLGQASHILAAVTMFLAFDIDYFTDDMKTFGIAVLSVWVAVQLLWHIVFEVLSCRGKPFDSSDPSPGSDQETQSKKSSFQTLIFGIYVVVLAGLCIAALLAFLLF